MAPIRNINDNTPVYFNVQVVSNAGSGSRRQVEVAEGTTVGEIANHSEFSINLTDNVARMNGQPATASTVLVRDAILTFAPNKTPGAR